MIFISHSAARPLPTADHDPRKAGDTLEAPLLGCPFKESLFPLLQRLGGRLVIEQGRFADERGHNSGLGKGPDYRDVAINQLHMTQ